jgi:2-polyprenyl-3-methyl-5-hydroxy-6-metoxy-1,4-benzoquinol methylase
MSTAKAGVFSQPPTVKVEPVKKGKKKEDLIITAEELAKILPEYTEEQKKYIKCWDHEPYRRFSPGENCLETFVEAAQPAKGCTVIDWGCGTGRAALKLHEHGLDVTAVDFAYN